jgi:hypothetical protein
MQLTEPRHTTIHPNDETAVVISTVILKEGSAAPRIETALFESDYGRIDYGNPIGIHQSILDDGILKEPQYLRDNVRDIEHALALGIYKARYAKTYDLHGLFNVMSRLLRRIHGVEVPHAE